MMRWRHGTGAGDVAAYYTVPAAKPAHGACRALASDFLLPHVVGLSSAVARPTCPCGAAILAAVTTSPDAAPYAALVVAALLLADNPPADKARMRACLAQAQGALGLSSTPRELEKELWAFVQARRERAEAKLATPQATSAGARRYA